MRLKALVRSTVGMRSKKSKPLMGWEVPKSKSTYMPAPRLRQAYSRPVPRPALPLTALAAA